MKTAEKGDKVKVHYTGTLDDGTVFDSSKERDPLEFSLGEGRLIPGFEAAVLGMSAGQVKTVKIEAAKAYGLRRDELVTKIERSKFPESIAPEPGACLNLRQADGGVLDVVITEVSDDMVTLDGNHPLAGKDLTFELEVIEVAV